MQVEEAMNLYVLVDSNCNMTRTVYQSTIIYFYNIENKIVNSEIEQLFGYIEYGNGANQLFSIQIIKLMNADFYSMLKQIKQKM